jgi:predicted transposase/invertase (TIGR01784 family)
MQFRPIDEVVRDIHIRDAEEYGMEKGMEKGREEGRLAVARKMLERQMPLNVISEVTELSGDEIRTLMN